MITPQIAPSLFTQSDDLLHTYLSLDQVNKHIMSVGQTHQIPDWSLQQKQFVHRLHVSFFSNQICEKLKKKTGELFEVVRTDVNDQVLCIVDFSKPVDLEQKTEALVRHSLHETLKIESLDKLKSFVKRRQMDVEDPFNIASNYLQNWLSYQKRLERNKCLDELKAAVRVLNENSFESNELIFEGMTAASLLDSVYEQFESEKIADGDLFRIQQKLGVLL